ncbi:MAG: TetR/AcrR family transcriptional regulator [Gemmatimonadaceae bacterium]|jgi:AcrR family transcriptional regulator|nr:TetR/AcrR family transcriptional regulator [Gemmatimonadaceae bacterium]
MSAAAQRILTAAAEQLAVHGPARLSMQDVAEAAEVSKGLIHYHFHDKETLLARVADWVTQACLAREQEALAQVDAATALDAVWMWLTAEVAAGQRRLLFELASEGGPVLRETLARSAAARRAQATETVRAVFRAFGISPRVSPSALGELFASVVDGLVVAAAVDGGRERRAVFDAFWLGVLALGRDG